MMKNNKIYADCYQTAVTIFNSTKQFQKHLRPTLGRQMEETILKCLLSIRKANTAHKSRRLQYLWQASDALDDLRTVINLSKDLQALRCSAYSELCGLTAEIGKELGGFIKHTTKYVTT